ncbi:ornithine cyclodeaminase family protein [Flavonifractor sp. An306]|uniref:ornithine cyclodeaminase family protein n=1 Tax=Flavonifractor sp. An306 TaxID=1965629 RepID=UPI00174BDAE2|nr:ornithine cyclodeaminase family protein [Flavonifractor sp. An306]
MAINYPQEQLLLLSEDDVLALLTPADVITLAEDTFYRVGTGEITVGEMGLMYVDPEHKNNFHSMPAILRHRAYAGVKWIDTYAAPLPGYPFSHGNLVALSDTRTGSPVAIVGATNITNMRTAGGHGVVQARHLANPEPEVLTVFGCGAQARAGIRGFLEGFPSLKQLRLFSRSRGPMEEVRRQYDGRVKTVLCAAPEEALAGSNLVLMASGAQQALFPAELLRPGTTVIGIEGFRDLDPRLGKTADKWYLGYRVPDAHILRSPKLNPGHLLTESDVFGDMTELLTGKCPGREREDEIIVSTHMGMGAHDVNCAATVYERAREQGLGQTFRLA